MTGSTFAHKYHLSGYLLHKRVCWIHVFLTVKYRIVLSFVKGKILVFLMGLALEGASLCYEWYVQFGRGTKNKFIHVILFHLVLKIPEAITSLGLRNLLDLAGYNTMCYLQWVAKGLSICTGGLLSRVQAIIISSRDSVWRKFKPRSSWHVVSLFFNFIPLHHK